MEEVSKEGIEAMSEVGTVAVILPTTAYILRHSDLFLKILIRKIAFLMSFKMNL